MKANVRIAFESDAGEIASLVNRAYRPSSPTQGWTHEAHLVSGTRISPNQVSALFRPRSCILALYREETIVACVHVQGDASVADIGILATDPSCQNQGLGKQMLDHAEKYALEHFKSVVFRMSVLASRPELISFYERRGYTRTGQVDDYPVSAGVGQPIIKGFKIEVLSKQSILSELY